jgi:hypothetical protein
VLRRSDGAQQEYFLDTKSFVQFDETNALGWRADAE